mgnify:CR=1 FL=1
MLSCGSVTEIGSFDSKRKPFVLFLGPFRGPFFHQGLEWFLLFCFLLSWPLLMLAAPYIWV